MFLLSRRVSSFYSHSFSSISAAKRTEFCKPQLLYRLNRLPSHSDPSCVTLHDIVTTEAERAILTTYKVDLLWLIKQCPILGVIPTTLIHGDKHYEYEVGFLFLSVFLFILFFLGS